MYDALSSKYIGAPTVINTLSAFRKAYLASSEPLSYEQKAFRNILMKQRLREADDFVLPDTVTQLFSKAKLAQNPPTFLKNALENSFFQKLFSELPEASVPRQISSFAKQVSLTQSKLMRRSLATARRRSKSRELSRRRPRPKSYTAPSSSWPPATRKTCPKALAPFW